MPKNTTPVYYHDYLKLDQLLGAQKPLGEAHDETLFIIVHQAYEIWFKQILHELDSVLNIMSTPQVAERDVLTVVSRLQRILKIQDLMLKQIEIMETMTPLDFLDFRELLTPASGFQSVQFRLIEAKLGLRTDSQAQAPEFSFLGRLSPEHQKVVSKASQSPGLQQLVEKWLERIPFLSEANYSFWQSYQKAVHEMLDADEQIIKSNPLLGPKRKELEVQELASNRETFKALWDKAKYQELLDNKQVTLSQKAMHAALFISLYRDEPLLHGPFKLLLSLMDLDEQLTTWRYRHAIMAQRMLGSKIGTGGSSGHQYLKASAERKRLFLDFFNLSTFLIPRRALPELPPQLRERLGFNFK